MEPENAVKSADLGEEDLVDYEEEEDTATTVEKASENAKDPSNKYASSLYSLFF